MIFEDSELAATAGSVMMDKRPHFIQSEDKNGVAVSFRRIERRPAVSVYKVHAGNRAADVNSASSTIRRVCAVIFAPWCLRSRSTFGGSTHSGSEHVDRRVYRHREPRACSGNAAAHGTAGAAGAGDELHRVHQAVRQFPDGQFSDLRGASVLPEWGAEPLHRARDSAGARWSADKSAGECGVDRSEE